MTAIRSLRLVQDGETDPVIRRQEFEAARPDVTILTPATLNSCWQAVVPMGSVPGQPVGTMVSDWDLSGLMDQLDMIYEPPE